jgi:hypothetical protein
MNLPRTNGLLGRYRANNRHAVGERPGERRTVDEGPLDNVNGYDVELVRIILDGLILVAKNGMCSLLSFIVSWLSFDVRASFTPTFASS